MTQSESDVIQARLSPFEEVLDDYRAGKMVIIVDASDRENEGDLAVATEMLTTDKLSFMMREARGLICTTITPAISKKLDLPLQVMNNSSPFNTPFAVSIDCKEVLHTGVTASSRTLTMHRLVSEDACADDFISPGSVFPLISNPAGVLGRQGQTEGAFDLARISGLQPSGVICEIMNEDGSMARGGDINEFARKHELKVTSVGEIIKYRLREEVFVRKVAESELETDFGTFSVSVFQDDVLGKEHLALVYGDLRGSINADKAVLVRVHSECLTGDVFGSRRCDCCQQLHQSMNAIVEAGVGVLLYLRQEGRGIGLANKLKAYELQDRGLDTVEANIELGFAADERDFVVAARMLSALKIEKVRLLTNNPDKVKELKENGIQVQERIGVEVPHDPISAEYLNTKREKLGHLF